jgi:hypothetical protein
MPDKHILPLDVLREYRVDLSIPHEATFDIVSCVSIDEAILADFAKQHGFGCELTRNGDGFFMAALTKRLLLKEEFVRPLSEAVERLCAQHGWDYSGWGASSYK